MAPDWSDEYSAVKSIPFELNVSVTGFPCEQDALRLVQDIPFVRAIVTILVEDIPINKNGASTSSEFLTIMPALACSERRFVPSVTFNCLVVSVR